MFSGGHLRRPSTIVSRVHAPYVGRRNVWGRRFVESIKQTAFDGLSDAELLGLIERHDIAAFEALYDRYAGHVTAMCLRRLRDPEAADELTQDIFSQIWHGKVRYSEERALFTTWLFTIIRNRCVDVIRARGRRPIHETVEVDPVDPNMQSPETTAYGSECREALTEALAALPDTQRRAVELCIIKGLSHSEAAEELGEPLGTLKSRVKIGMEKLRVSLRRVR